MLASDKVWLQDTLFHLSNGANAFRTCHISHLPTPWWSKSPHFEMASYWTFSKHPHFSYMSTKLVPTNTYEFHPLSMVCSWPCASPLFRRNHSNTYIHSALWQKWPCLDTNLPIAFVKWFPYLVPLPTNKSNGPPTLAPLFLSQNNLFSSCWRFQIPIALSGDAKDMSSHPKMVVDDVLATSGFHL
jgi:hypothetical protein